MTDLYYDPYNIEIDNDPYPVWKRMRDEEPAYYNEKHDFYALTRFDDVEPAERDTKTFISSHGTVLEVMQPEPLDTAQLMFLDPPEHPRLRALVSRSFTPRRVELLQDRIRQLCTELLDRVEGQHRFDYVKEYASVLPALVISSMLGVPEGDQEALRAMINHGTHVAEDAVDVDYSNKVSNRPEDLDTYIRGQLAECRANPRDDMFTELACAQITEDDGSLRHLTDSEAVDFGGLLYAAGTDTVAKLLGWACVLLAQNPDQRAELAADFSLLPNAIEETLRYEAPSPITCRWTTRDVEYHGVTIPANSKVVLVAASANRDERHYPDPDRYDIHRAVTTHLSFAVGPHFCIGHALARMEARIALEETLKRYPEWEVDTDAAVRLHTTMMRGYQEVPIFV